MISVGKSGAPSRRRSSEVGFTLIELLVGMVIVGLLSGLSVTGWSSYQRALEQNGTAQEVLSVLRNAEQRSLSEASTYCVAFDTANRSYQVYKFACGGTGTAVGSTKKTRSSRVTIASASFLQPGGSSTVNVSFYARGSATKGAVVIGRQGKPRKLTITVEGLTGRVSLAG